MQVIALVVKRPAAGDAMLRLPLLQLPLLLLTSCGSTLFAGRRSEGCAATVGVVAAGRDRPMHGLPCRSIRAAVGDGTDYRITPRLCQ